MAWLAWPRSDWILGLITKSYSAMGRICSGPLSIRNGLVVLLAHGSIIRPNQVWISLKPLFCLGLQQFMSTNSISGPNKQVYHHPNHKVYRIVCTNFSYIDSSLFCSSKLIFLKIAENIFDIEILKKMTKVYSIVSKYNTSLLYKTKQYMLLKSNWICTVVLSFYKTYIDGGIYFQNLQSYVFIAMELSWDKTKVL